MNYSLTSDEDLLKNIASGEKDALGELYDRYGRLVYSLALNSVGDQSVAEEITQEVFLRVWEKAHTYQSQKAQVNTWITRITRYRSIDVLRKRGARQEDQQVRWSELSPSEMVNVDGRNPEWEAERSIQGRQAKEAIASLPPEQQQVLALAYFQGLSHQQIADTMAIPLGTVKTRIRLGMQKLRQHFQKYPELDRSKKG